MLWNIQGTPHQILGSIHLLPKLTALPAWVTASLSKKKRVVFESPPADQKAMELVFDQTKAHLAIPATKALCDRAVSLLRIEGKPDFWEYAKPWFLALHVGLASLKRHGVMNEIGIEQSLGVWAEKSGMQIGHLEPSGSVFELFNSCPEPSECVAFLDQMLNGFAVTEYPATLAAWVRSDLEALDHIRVTRCRDFPSIFPRIVDQRNLNWATTALGFCADGQPPTLFVVGALHCVGERSFLARLRERGIETVPAW
jgi:uncharacterized protein YbaP (TraB family)